MKAINIIFFLFSSSVAFASDLPEFPKCGLVCKHRIKNIRIFVRPTENPDVMSVTRTENYQVIEKADYNVYPEGEGHRSFLPLDGDSEFFLVGRNLENSAYVGTYIMYRQLGGETLFYSHCSSLRKSIPLFGHCK